MFGIVVASTGNLLTGLAPVLAVVVCQIVRGTGIATRETMLHTLIPREVPDAMLGRVFANVYGAVRAVRMKAAE